MGGYGGYGKQNEIHKSNMKDLYNELEKIHFEIQEFKEIKEHFSERAKSFKNNLIVFIEEKLFNNKILIENLNEIIVDVSNEEQYLVAYNRLINFSKQLLDLFNKSKNLEELESWIEFNYFKEKYHKLKSELILQFEDWFNSIQNIEWKNWYENKIDTLSRLEKTYESNLKLQKPARYWQIKSNKYFTQGNQAKKILVGLVVFSSLFLGLILVIAPDWIFQNVFKGNQISIVRWSIVFITLISLIVYAIRALTKYMFSSFHLARDAEERHTLTFFYLALSKDTNVNDEDRTLILQSLFSRTDTGLLKEDSSPTMPTIFEKFSGKV